MPTHFRLVQVLLVLLLWLFQLFVLPATCHHLETIRQENAPKETSQAVDRRPGQMLERHDLAEDSAREAVLKTARRGHRPTTGHYRCPIMKMMKMMMRTLVIIDDYYDEYDEYDDYDDYDDGDE